MWSQNRPRQLRCKGLVRQISTLVVVAGHLCHRPDPEGLLGTVWACSAIQGPAVIWDQSHMAIPER